MLRWLRRLLVGPIRAHDALFGDMRYMGGYWEAQGVFPPTGESVEYFVAGDETGPAQPYREAFERICEYYTSIHPRALDAIQSAARDSGEGCPPPESIRLSGIDVPASLEQTARWELMFDGPDGVFIAVEMLGPEPAGPVEWAR